MKMLSGIVFFLCGVLLCAAEAPAVVRASSFGFDEKDATECLQKAIDSGAQKVIVENMGKPWIVRPLKLRSRLHMLFKAGAVVEAKRGEYYDIHASLFTAKNCNRITMEGEKGAVLRMQKKDYHNPKLKYARSQWRNCIQLDGCYNVTIRNLTIASSGGDGIYLGRTYGENGRIACRNILIENCLIDDHHRQGISVISAIGMTVRNCTISNTRGTEPEAGIDFEPNYPDEKFNNILIEKCRFVDNHWSGINFSIFTTTPIDITVRDCTLVSKYALPQLTFCLLEPFAKSGGGTVLIENCKVQNTLGSNLSFMNFASDTNYQVNFKNVELIEKNDGNTKVVAPSPIVFSATSPKTTRMGGVHFDNLKVTGYKGVPLFNLQSMLGNKNVEKVTGNVVWNGRTQDAARVVAEDSALHRKPYKAPKFAFREPGSKPAPGNTMSAAIRFDSDIAIWAKKGRKVSFRIEQRYFDGAPNSILRGKTITYKLTSPSGKTVDMPFVIPQDKVPACTRDFEFVPEETGLHYLHFTLLHRKGGSRLVAMFHGSPDLVWGVRGAAVQEGRLNFRDQPGLKCPDTVEGVFEVPAGVREFWIDTDIMNFSVTDPAGNVYRVPRARSQQQRLKLKRAHAGKPEIWKLKAEKFTSLEFLFSENLPGILSPDASRLPRVK